MAQFLATVSGAPPEDWLHGVGEGGERGELGRHLATLHTVLVDSVCKVPAVDCQGLEGLKTVLNDISNNLHHPTSTTLESIAEPTPFKIKRMSVEEKSPPTSSSSSGGLSNWIGLSWTLGRGEKRSNSKVPHSVPIPQHELRMRASGKSTFYPSSSSGLPDVSTESSSSSASLSPSPKYSTTDPRSPDDSPTSSSSISYDLSGCGTTANPERSCQPPRSRSSRTLTASPAPHRPTTAQGQGWARRTPRCPGEGRGRRVGHFQITRGGQHLQKHHVLLTGAAAAHIFCLLDMNSSEAMID